jgi:hypothetical protein
MLGNENIKEWEVRGESTPEPGMFSVQASADFGPVLKLRDPGLFRVPRLVSFSGKIDWEGMKDIQFAVSLAENGELAFYKVFLLSENVSKSSDRDWSDFRFLVPIPETKGNDVELSVYLWNTEHIPYVIKDVEARLY